MSLKYLEFISVISAILSQMTTSLLINQPREKISNMNANLNMLPKFAYQRKDVPNGSVLGPVGFNIFTTDPNSRLENRLIKLRV